MAQQDPEQLEARVPAGPDDCDLHAEPTLRELEPRARAALTVLLALLLARVAGQEAALLERGAIRGVEQLERARDAVAQRIGLAGDAAAVQRRGDVVAPDAVHGLERLVDDHARRLAREVVLERAPVHAHLPGADLQAHARDLRSCACPVATNVWGSGKIEDLRLLGGVRMLGPGVDLELAEHLPAQRILREHAAHRALEHALGVGTAEQLVSGGRPHVTRPAGVVAVGLLLRACCR
jgi:hypothetical protein